MRLDKVCQWGSAIALAIGIAGCASVPPEHASQDAALKSFTIAPDRAGVFVYQDEAAGNVKISVEVDGKPIGQTGFMTYLYKEVTPGRHTVTSKAENTDSIEFDAQPGTQVYVWQQLRIGWLYPRTKLHVMSEAEGKKGVLQASLSPDLVKTGTSTQTLQVRVQADDPTLSGTMNCKASNDLGNWPFSAPGVVTVMVSGEPLQVLCSPPADMTVDPVAAAPHGPTPPAKSVATGTKAGAVVGIVVGGAVGAVLAGPLGFALLAPGSAVQGASIGGLIGTMQKGDQIAYPGEIVVHLKRKPAQD